MPRRSKRHLTLSSDETDAALAPDSAGHSGSRLGVLVVGAIGVVYGDIGTSPIYALRESLHAASRDGLTREDTIGVISILFWTLIIIVTLKYVIVMLRADNDGEGGTLSLVALANRALGRRPLWLLILGMAAVGLFLGDAAITPAISVLSAVEGMSLVTPAFQPYVIPVTLGIIAGLFLMQSRGTGAVAMLFGPITVVWFIAMAILGLIHIGDDPGILAAVNPWHAMKFLLTNGLGSFVVIGSVFLAVTGGEALYADMGHFGRKPIRIAWIALVFPALALSYLGQGALVLANPAAVENPFFLMAPDWALLPLVLLATMATVIASQAVISGAFSITKQAVQMGLLPRMEILHTSASEAGQIYLPRVNFWLAIAVVILVVAFGSSSSLASAYGIAVSGVMVITTVLAGIVVRMAWKWSVAGTAALVVPLLLIEGLFLAANSLKLFDGGYVPVLMAAAVGLTMWCWVRGTAHVQSQARKSAQQLDSLIRILAKSESLGTVPGTAVFLTSDPEVAPAALMHNIKHNHVLHSQNLIVTVVTATQPKVRDAERLTIERLSDRFVRIILQFGYMEETNVPKALALARRLGIKFDIMTTSFFLNRRSFRSDPKRGIPVWQERIFIALTRAATTATDYYRLPVNRTIELGQQLLI
jgi:KUP system potassium uptake protein